MGNLNNRILVASNVIYQLLCMDYHKVDATFELKYRLIHLLPTFHGLKGEDMHKHLKEFYVVCTTMKPHIIKVI